MDIGDKVKNIRDGKYGIVIRKFKSGSIAVLENVAPIVITTHDSDKTLELIEKSCIDIFDENKENTEMRVYLFQNWEFGSQSVSKFNQWDKEGKILDKLIKGGIYTHTDNGKNGFLLISLDKGLLLKTARKRKMELIEKHMSEIKRLSSIEFE